MPRIPVSERREALVKAALGVIERDGVHAATTRAIVTEAGMSLASFHYAFDSRDALMRAVIDHVIAGEEQAAAAASESSDDVRGIIAGALRGYLRLLRSRPGHEQAVLELFHYSLRTEELSQLPEQQYAAYRRAVGALLIAAAERAGIRWSLPVDDVARLVVSFTDGLTLSWLADRDDAAAERFVSAAIDMIAGLATDADTEGSDS